MKNARYIYVAKKQSSKFAVLDIHTLEEKLLFTNILTNSFATTEINYDAFAKMWNSNYANGEKIFYKTTEHIEKYHNH